MSAPDAFDFDFGDVLPAWAESARASIEQALRDTAPRSTGPTSGQFADGITAAVVGEGGAGTVEIDAEGDAVPGRFLLEGTAAHSIDPAAKRMLFWPGADHPVRHVNHPGTEPSDFVDRAIEDLLDELEVSLLDGISARWATG